MKRLLPTIVLAAALTAATRADAQLFGDRRSGDQTQTSPARQRMIEARGARLGGTGLQRQSPGSNQGRGAQENDVGLLMGDERFYRGNRSVADFVGRDAQDVRSFVGARQLETPATTTAGLVPRIESAISEEILQGPAPADVNLPPPPPSTTTMYEPRLRVDFRFSRPTGEAISSDLIRRLESSPALGLSTPLEVLLQDGTATLRGEVASQRERTLVELLVSFEPGISNVRNELTVRGSPGS